MIRVGLLGCGNIGHIIAKNRGNFEITALYDIIFDKARELADISGGVPYDDFDSFVMQDFDYVIEAASVKAVRLYGEKVLRNKKNLIVMSVGALGDVEYRKDLVGIAREYGMKIHIPSGAITGLDNLKAGQIAKIESLLLKTTKSPASLGITTDKKVLVFRGKANECIKEFPKNVNVSVALSLAAGMDAEVELWADPAVERNIHEIFLSAEFGDIYIRVNNVQSPDNPATSYLAALSILTLLNNLENPLVVGT